jgi:hypothetical protein
MICGLENEYSDDNILYTKRILALALMLADSLKPRTNFFCVYAYKSFPAIFGNRWYISDC